MKDGHYTKAKGCNDPNDRGKIISSSAAPKTIDGGVDLKKGYKVLGDPGRSPNADSMAQDKR